MSNKLPFEERMGLLCQAMGTSNPPEENRVIVRDVAFYFGGNNWQTIEGHKRNIGGRLFLQSFIPPVDQRFFDIEGVALDMLRHQAAEFYRERWDDAETAGRPMLVALKTAKLLRVFQKLEMLSEAA